MYRARMQFFLTFIKYFFISSSVYYIFLFFFTFLFIIIQIKFESIDYYLVYKLCNKYVSRRMISGLFFPFDEQTLQIAFIASSDFNSSIESKKKKLKRDDSYAMC